MMRRGLGTQTLSALGSEQGKIGKNFLPLYNQRMLCIFFPKFCFIFNMILFLVKDLKEKD